MINVVISGGVCVFRVRGKCTGTLMVLFMQEVWGTVKPLGCFMSRFGSEIFICDSKRWEILAKDRCG